MISLEDIQVLLDKIPFEYGIADEGAMYEVTDAIRLLDNPRQVVPLLFRWFEKHGDTDLGTPGPFVCFIQEVPDYLSILETSLRTLPTGHTLDMANQVVYRVKEPEQVNYWIDAIRIAANHPLADEFCKESAELFITHQIERLSAISSSDQKY